MVLEETEDGVFIYHGNTIDNRGKLAGSDQDVCQLRKFNALTGELVWQYDVPCVYESYLNGGMLATPLLGKDDFADLVIFNVCKTTSHAAGTLLALDKVSRRGRLEAVARGLQLELADLDQGQRRQYPTGSSATQPASCTCSIHLPARI